MGYGGADGFHIDQNSGGTIGGGGTLNYVAMFTPDGSHIGNAPIKVGDTITRAFPVNTGTDSIAFGFDITMSGTDGMLIGYDLEDNGGTEVYAFGNRLTLTGAGGYYGIVALGFNNSFDSPGGLTTGIYLLGDTNVFNDFNTFSSIIGEDNNLTRINHTSVLGLFNTLTDTTNVYNVGESNGLDTLTNSVIIGVSNIIDNSDNILNIGNGNVYTGITDAIVIGFNNANPLTNEILIAIGDEGIRVDQFGDVGIGVPSTSSIQAKLHVLGIDTVNNVNQRLEPITDVYQDTTGATTTITTGGASSTDTLQVIPIPLDTGVMIESFITARKSAGAGAGTVGDVNAYLRTTYAKNVAGVVTLGAIQTSYTSEDIGAFNATFDVSGTNVRVRVTTSSNNTAKWNVITKTYPVD